MYSLVVHDNSCITEQVVTAMKSPLQEETDRDGVYLVRQSLMGISPWSNGHHDDDSNDDEEHHQATAHPLARVLLVLLSLHQLVHARLHMVSSFAHLPTCQGRLSPQKETKVYAMMVGHDRSLPEAA